MFRLPQEFRWLWRSCVWRTRRFQYEQEKFILFRLVFSPHLCAGFLFLVAHSRHRPASVPRHSRRLPPPLPHTTYSHTTYSHTTHTHTHTCSETSYGIIDVECIVRAKTLQLNLTDTVKTVPFRGETERITKMMWPPALQQHPGASLRFLFRGETERITKGCDHQLCNSIQVRHYGSISWRDGQNHQIIGPPAMQQHPGASPRFDFVARRTESPNDVTTSYATASR